MNLSDQLNYQISGYEQGKKLVFLHGIMGSLSNWSRIKRQFEDKYHVLVLDQRGHGHSYHAPDSYTYPHYANDLNKLLAELGWSQIYLVGHSMGARVALVMTDLYPHVVKRLVLEDITPGQYVAATTKVEAWLNSVPVPFSSKAEAKAFLLGPQFAMQFETPQEAVAIGNFFFMNITEGPSGADWRFDVRGIRETLAEGHRHDCWREWNSLKIPTLVVRGERSFDLPREHFDQMLKSNPRARGIEIADSGHWVHFDQPEPFISAVRGFLDEER